MCRLFGQLAPSARSARPYLVDSKFSLLRQADFDKKNLQQDGWGIGWLGADGQARVEKSPAAAFTEAARFTEAAAQGRATGVIGHIRAASNPLGLPTAQIINLANTQPFSEGGWLFAHNGTLQIPLEIKKKLGKFADGLKSNNDSEVYFRQFLKFFEKTGRAEAAFEACIEENWTTWAEIKDSLPEERRKKGPYSGLNAIVTDGRRLFAFCHAAAKGLAACGACNPDQPWQTMSLGWRDGALIVASENLDDGAWNRFNPPEVLTAELADGAVKLHRTQYDFPGDRLVRKSEEEATLR